MKRKQQRLVRLVAIILAVLLGLGAVVSALLSFAYAEELAPEARNQCELTMEYLPEEQALRISQRLVYTNVSGSTLDRVIFYAPSNLFRRRNALPYDGENLAKALPQGYLPGGMDLSAVRVNGMDCDWGFQGENENFLRVACELESGESCTFEFDYYLLLTQNAAFLGVSDQEWHLSDFYFAPAAIDEGGSFTLNAALSHTRYTDVPAMDFSAAILLPEKLNLAATGTETIDVQSSGAAGWRVLAENVRDFALVISSGYRESTIETESGVQIRMLSDVKKAEKTVLQTAKAAIEACEAWLGKLPISQIDIVQAAGTPAHLEHSGCLWLDEELLKAGGQELAHAVRRFIAAQYFGRCAWAHPVRDAWLSDSIAEYLGYLLLEETEGNQAYLKALNEQLVPSLQLTIPGGLNVTSDASLFTAYEYQIVVRDRGAAVLHELRSAMGREELIDALHRFYQKGLQQEVLTEMDLVDALQEASGQSWEKFLTDWLFNIGDYVNQEISWLD